MDLVSELTDCLSAVLLTDLAQPSKGQAALAGLLQLVRASSGYTKVVAGSLVRALEKSTDECINGWNNKSLSLSLF